MSCITCHEPTPKRRHRYCVKCYRLNLSKEFPSLQEFLKWGDSYKPWISPSLLVATYQKCAKLWDDDFSYAMTMATNANIVVIQNHQAWVVLEKTHPRPKRNKPRVSSFLFGFPGGSRKPNENPIETGFREWVEETGIRIDTFKRVDIIYNQKSAGADIIILIYVDHIDTTSISKHTAIFQGLVSLKMIKDSKDTTWFQLRDQKINICSNTKEDRFRFRQCTYHKLDEIIEKDLI